MLRRSTKRCSSSRGEAKHGGNAASNALKGKRRKLGRNAETDDSKSADNSKHNAIQNKVQPKTESSDSSSDEFMRAPPLSDFDLDKFPEKKELALSDFAAIENNILTGVSHLSDSEDSDFEGDSEVKSVYSPPVKEKQNVTGCAKTSGKKNKTSDINKSRIRAKTKIAETSTRSLNMETDGMKILLPPDVNKMDVSQLLALGEGSGTISKVHTHRMHDLTSDSENDLSEWENVEGLGVTPTEHTIPKEGIEVTVEMPDLYRKRKKKGFDMEAHVRRRLNRVRRELQVLIHKVHLLCWIAHGRYVNSVLNSEILMAQCLSLIPSQHCYPSKHTNLSYLEQIVEWFKKTVSITESTESGPSLPLCDVLQQSFQLRIAHSARDLVLMFICILRTLGVKARLMISLQPLPLKPSNQDLCLNNKTQKSNELEQKDGTCVRGEETDIGDDSEAVSSKMSSQEENECLKGKKSRRSTKLKDEKQVDDANKKDKNMSNSDYKSKRRHDKVGKRRRNDVDISDEKMDKLKRTLRARKEIINMYKDKSDSSDEADASNQYTRAACSKKSSQNSRISSDRHHFKRSATDVSLTDQQKTLSKSAESSRRMGRVKTNKREHLPQTTSSTKEDENCDSDSDQSCDFKTTGSTDSNSDSDFKTKKKKPTNARVLDSGVLASDSGTSIEGRGTQMKKKKEKKNHCDVWTEVFLEEEEKWISVDVQRGKVHCIAELHSRATQPVMYVLAFNNDLTLKDVTCRYCVRFSTETRKLRVDEKWWKESLSPFLTAPTAQDREEDEQLNQLMLDRPLPTTLKEFKNHPLYVLKDDLLKFEAIYPPNAPPLGFVKGKPIYARECVHVLHSRDIWLKEAKVVRLGETPYKIVKARPKYDKMTGQFVKDLPLEVFGFWQVEDYVPPPAVNGKVPRNEYGNVELFKPCMLPKGTVHLQLPGLNRVARKLGIDCAPAVVGFDFHCGGTHPVLDGLIVCEEHKDMLLDAWNQEQEEAEKREQEKLEKRVYGSWRRLIKGLLIRERLKKRYSFGDEAGPSEPKKISSKKQSGSGKKEKQKTARKTCKIQMKEEDSDDDDGDWD